MKKKILLTILCGVCLLGITGCGSNKEKKKNSEENNQKVDISKMKKEAVDIDINTIINSSQENSARAEKEYVGNVYKFKTTVGSIDTDHIFKQDTNGVLYVYMSQDDLAKLNKDDEITVIGRIRSASYPVVIVEDGFLVE